MLKLRTFIIIVLVYVIAFLSLKLNLNLLYPYYYIKDLFIYPVIALNKNKDLEVSQLFQDNYNNELESEIKALKELSGIKTITSEFTIINASIIERNRLYWFNSLIIDKGTNDGLEKDMAVINQDGLIGKINKVSKYTSEIKLITTNDVNSKVSVAIDNDGQKIYGVMSGYDIEKSAILITLTNKNIEINNESIVKTTGMGGIFPSGILIGKVIGLEKDKYDVGKIVLVKPFCDIENIKYVGILKRK